MNELLALSKDEKLRIVAALMASLEKGHHSSTSVQEEETVYPVKMNDHDKTRDTSLEAVQLKTILLRKIIHISDEETLAKLLAFVDNTSEDWWNDLSDAEKASIESGIKDAEVSRVVPHADVRKRYEKWL